MWLATALAPAQALAHPGVGDPSGFWHGLAHPFSGIDHVLVMFGIGLLAWLLGGKARWRLPLTFLGIMAFSTLMAASQMALPGVEPAIALSVLGTGALLANRKTRPLALALPLVVLFAVVHGYAHGSGMPVGTSSLAFCAGITTATALLHGSGLLAGWMLALLGQARSLLLNRVAGIAICTVAMVLLLGAG